MGEWWPWTIEEANKEMPYVSTSIPTLPATAAPKQAVVNPYREEAKRIWLENVVKQRGVLRHDLRDREAAIARLSQELLVQARERETRNTKSEDRIRPSTLAAERTPRRAFTEKPQDTRLDPPLVRQTRDSTAFQATTASPTNTIAPASERQSLEVQQEPDISTANKKAEAFQPQVYHKAGPKQPDGRAEAFQANWDDASPWTWSRRSIFAIGLFFLVFFGSHLRRLGRRLKGLSPVRPIF
jgi:hypothetical protein